MTMVLHWDEGGTEVQVSTTADLDQELDRLALTASAAGGPLLVRVYDRDDPSGAMLTVGERDGDE